MLKKISIVLLCVMFCPNCLAIQFGSSNFSDTSATKNYVKFAPQQNNYNYNGRYMKQKKNYIYSPQQAQYYGYRMPQQQTGQPTYRYQGTYSQNYYGYGR